MFHLIPIREQINRLLFILFLISGLHANIYSITIKASSFGFDSTDATSSVQNALLSGADTVIIDYMNSDWIIKPLILTGLSNIYIKIEEGVVIQAKSGAFPNTGDCLFRFRGCSDITISGYGAKLIMHKNEYTDGEWRHGISLLSCSDIVIKGLTIRETGGDGIYVGVWSSGAQTYCSDITIQDCVCDNNYRQGISVISVDNLKVSYCEFTNTKGTLPEAGVDFEPNDSYNRLANVSFKDCRFTGNYGNGIKFALANLDSASVPVSVNFNNCYVSDNGDTSNVSATSEIRFSARKTGAVTGTVTFDNCFVENSKWTAVYSRKTSNSYFITFNNTVFRDVSKSPFGHNEPLRLEVTDYGSPCPRFGGIAFNNCLLKYDSDYPYLGIYPAATTPGTGDITGNITVVSPDNSLPDYGDDPLNVTLTQDFITTIPVRPVSVNSTDSILNEENTYTGRLQFSRTGDSINFPLPVKYSTSGSALSGTDYHRLVGYKIIPAGMSSVEDSLIALEDNEDEDIEICTLTLCKDPFYLVGSDSTASFYFGLIPASVNETESEFQSLLYPNPCKDHLCIGNAYDSGRIEYTIYNTTGIKIREGYFHRDVLYLDIPAGLYFIRLICNNRSEVLKFLVTD